MEPITDLYGNDDIEAMYQAALAVPLADKIDMAIKLIQTFEGQALELSPDGYYVCFSGGKDSIVMAKLFEMSGAKYGLHYNNVTVDPPGIVYFVRKHYPQAKWHSTGKNLPLSTVERPGGLPTRRGRWCCEVFKEQRGQGCLQAVGVRAAESARRKGLWRTINSVRGEITMAPIVYWTDADVWQFIRQNNLEYCKLYDEGFKRLGCVGCPIGGKNRTEEFRRWPRFEEVWKRGARLWWETWKDKLKPDGTYYFAHKFPTFESYWSWWMEEKNVNDTDNADCQMFLW